VTLPVARVRAPWWRRLIARWRARLPLPEPTVAIRIPEYAGGGEVHVLVNETPYIGMPVRMPTPGPGAKRLG